MVLLALRQITNQISTNIILEHSTIAGKYTHNSYNLFYK